MITQQEHLPTSKMQWPNSFQICQNPTAIRGSPANYGWKCLFTGGIKVGQEEVRHYKKAKKEDAR